MDPFGPLWENHAERVRENWQSLVGEEDIVLIAGDTSWALKLEGALADLEWIDDLPGRKILVKGNHDYWWSSIGKVRKAAPESLSFVQNDALEMDGVAVAGTRLWDFPGTGWPIVTRAEDHAKLDELDAAPGSREQASDDEKIRARELERLRLGLSRLSDAAKLRVALVHFPPVGAAGEPTALTAMLREHRVDLCVFGHVHSQGDQRPPASDAVIDGVRCVLTSCDFLQCRPLLLAEL